MVAAGMMALMAGCESAGHVAAKDAYQPPPTGAPAALVRGSEISEGGLFGDEHRGFVGMIDLQPIEDAARRWNEAIALTPGSHTIVAEYRYSNFMTRAYVPLEAKAGVTYQLMIRNSRNDAEGRLYNDFWIVDTSTGAPVTAVYRRQVTGGKKGTVFNVNK